ncbi:hypothetical protein PV325_009203 [Microctonus aethiopoides]|nr:hypothetical protein PV325_009203 [Microctonus aethiopoides]
MVWRVAVISVGCDAMLRRQWGNSHDFDVLHVVKYSGLTVVTTSDSTEWNSVACTKGDWGFSCTPRNSTLCYHKIVITCDSTEWNFVECTKGYWGTKRKFNDLQTLKKLLPQDYPNFFDTLRVESNPEE